MNNKDYYIGLDIGTNSVGYAVTDKNYCLIRAKGRDLWGANLFEEGQTAQERRLFRVGRRLLQRRKKRILWLQKEFSSQIFSTDPGFFERMREANFLFHDKNFSDPLFKKNKNILFCEDSFKDKDYYKCYPTIYHLRKAQIDNKPEAFDIRFLYLTIHHIFKHRGHFLYGNIDLDGLSFKELLADLKIAVENAGFDNSIINDFEPDFIGDVLCDETLSSLEKLEKIKNKYDLGTATSFEFNLIKLILGNKISISCMLSEESNETTKKISVKDDLELDKDIIIELVGEDKFDIIVKSKALYDFSLIEKIIKDSQNISSAKVKEYEKHKRDLELLKKCLKDSGVTQKKYDDIMCGDDSYEAYSGHLDKSFYKKAKKEIENNKKIIEKPKLKSVEEFNKKILDALKNVESPDAIYIKKEINNNSFLPKQSYVTNSVIPYQLHKIELEQILDNAQKFHPFLLERDDSKITLKDRIMKMFEFKIPYYVGPLNDSSQFSWVIRKDKNNRQHIFPWNFEDIVDIRSTAEEFCNRLIGSCTYLKTCKVLPKESLLYSKFSVLNEINNLCVNNVKISVEVKQLIFNNLFLKNTKVSLKLIKDYLINQGIIEKGDTVSGSDKILTSNLKPYISVGKILGSDFYLNDIYRNAVEDIINRATLFANDVDMVDSYIRDNYCGVFSDDQIKRLSRMQFSGWGRLSKEFLILKDENGQRLIDKLWETNENLMHILFSTEHYIKYISESISNRQDITIDDFLDESYAAPSIKKSIRQANIIVDAIVEQMGCEPEKIFIEVTRKQEINKQRTKTRKQQLTDAFKLFKHDKHLKEDILKTLQPLSDSDLRKEKLYLYFLQLGKCMYSGDSINLNLLFTSDYQVEHIYPKSKFPRQDGLDNKVLVKAIMNQEKKDEVISENIVKKMQTFWKHLKECKLLTDKKYNRLLRVTPFSEQEVDDFINAQLTDTSQSVKLVSEFFKNKYKNSKVVYSKAKFVSDFRKAQQRESAHEDPKLDLTDIYGFKKIIDPIFVKSRLINNTHHAKDAYLNIVVGNVYHTAFTKKFYLLSKIQNGFHKAYLFNNLFNIVIKDNDEIVWLPGNEGSIKNVCKVMIKNSAYISRKCTEKHGQIVSKRKPSNSGTIPYKQDLRFSNLNKNGRFIYGGYNQGFLAYYCMYEDLNEQKKYLMPIDLIDKVEYEKDAYLFIKKKLLNKSDIAVVHKKILSNAVFIYKGNEIRLIGKTNNYITYGLNFELSIAPKWNPYIAALENLIGRIKSFKQCEISEGSILNEKVNIQLYDILVDKIYNSNLIHIMQKVHDTLVSRKADFENAKLVDQCSFLVNLISFIQNPNTKIDLKLLGGSGKAGAINISMKELANCKLVHRNILGTLKYIK